MIKKILTIIGLSAILSLGVNAQLATNTPPANTTSLFSSLTTYFTSFNTELDSTFGESSGQIWTGVDSLQNDETPLANSFGLSYNIYKNTISVENLIRDGGVNGVIISEQAGFGFNIIVHDTKLTIYADGGYNFVADAEEEYFGEVGLRVQKALTKHIYAGAGMGVQIPNAQRSFTAFSGITF